MLRMIYIITVNTSGALFWFFGGVFSASSDPGLAAVKPYAPLFTLVGGLITGAVATYAARED